MWKSRRISFLVIDYNADTQLCVRRISTSTNPFGRNCVYTDIVSKCESQDSVVGVTTGYGLDNRTVGVRVQIGSRIFSTPSRPAVGLSQPPIQCVPGVKQEGREAGHSPQAIAEVKKMWIYTSTSPYAFMA
jgi:hypothetical protein